MCGFGGIINSERQLNTPQLSKVAGKVSFRGPDSCGIRILNDDLEQSNEGRFAVFFNRLAIIDLDKRSDQPFENDDYLLSFNGEIYNYLELRTELEKKGVSFITKSDTEVLFHALIEWGESSLPKLNGMFAFFWLDKKKKRFIVARDRLGIKPLYYGNAKGSFCFASELDSIITFMNGSAEINSDAVKMFLWMQFVPTPHTIIRDVQKLPPGYYLEGQINQSASTRLKKYWDAYNAALTPAINGSHDLITVLRNSLERQLHADVPLGLFLSSGVDSSLLAALVNKYFAKESPVNFFTVRFNTRTDSDESEDARSFIEGFQNPLLHCTTISIDPQFAQNHVEQLYNYYDEPFADPASLLNWMISSKAREYVTVAISGDGADEMFWGYPRYNRWKKFKKISRLPVISNLSRAATPLLPPIVGNNLRFLFEQDPVKRHYNFFLPSGMRFNIKDHITKYPMWALEGVEKIRDREDLPALLDIKTYLADAMLYKVDRSSMASSLEVRVPYLDNEVIDYAMALPLSEKSNSDFHTKAPLKKLLTQLAPHYNPHLPKKGFGFPLQEWLKHNWKDQVLATVNSNDLITAGLDPKPYKRLVEDFYRSRNDYFTDVWYIFNLSLWIKKFKNIAT